ncbi:MAG: hypothetical protein ABFS45_23335 [Pseudomonadota bacterium]
MIEQTLRELLEDKVDLDIEGIDRLYLNAYQPRLQTGGGVVGFFREHRGAQVASTTLMAPMSKDFVSQIYAFAKQHGIDVVHFQKGQRKDEVTLQQLKEFGETEGVLYIGVAQEKFAGFRVRKKVSEHTGTSFPWLYRSTMMCNQYYFYVVDEDFGPLFIKFSSYFPYTARICLNGHEYAKRQLDKAGIVYEALDNGVRTCAEPARLQQILDELNEGKIEAVVRKWFARLPHPFSPADRAAGYRYDVSILQAEFARTQVFDRPLSGRHLFEEVIRENIDLGRLEKISQDCQLGEAMFDQVNRPQVVDGQPASALGFGDPRVMALFQALCLFMLLPQGFRNATLRSHVAPLMGESSEDYTPGRMTYDLRRLRLHGVIIKIPGTHRYEVTDEGIRICLFLTKVHVRVIRPGFSQLMDGCPKAPNRAIANTMRQLDRSMEQLIDQAKLAA